MFRPKPSLFADPPQTPLPVDDIGGLQLVHARFERSEPFSWELFAGYNSLRIVTCSASIPAIVCMLSDFSFPQLDCGFESEWLGSLQTVIAFQTLATAQTWAAIRGLEDERKMQMLAEMQAGRSLVQSELWQDQPDGNSDGFHVRQFLHCGQERVHQGSTACPAGQFPVLSDSF